MKLYGKSFSSSEEAEKDYQRLQDVLSKLNMVTLATQSFQTYGGAGKSSTLLGCPGAVELKLANWDRKTWKVTLELEQQIAVVKDK